MALKIIDLTVELRRIQFLVTDLIPLGYVSFVGALEGAGKTMLSSLLAVQMSRPDGRGQFLGQFVPRGPVIYVNTDAADGEARPVRYWLEMHATMYPDADLSLITVMEPSGAGLTPDEFRELLSIAREMKARCIIIDSFMSTFPGIDGNRLDQAMVPMLALRDLASQSGAAVIVLDHLPKKRPQEREGDRGIMGSTGKSAQARAVHLLTRVPPHDVDGREVLRWDVRKNSFARSGYAMGVEVERLTDEDGRMYGVNVQVCDLPDEPHRRDTRLDRARSAVIALLTASPGQPIAYAELEATAVRNGTLKARSAQQAVREAVGSLGECVEARGRPRVYTYTAQASPQRHDTQDEAVPVFDDALRPDSPGQVEVLMW